jgi:hypothetical protein
VPTYVLPALLWLLDPWHDVLAVILVAVLCRPTADIIRFALASPAARRHYPGMIRARHRWHWLCRCTGLGQPELAARNRPAAESRVLILVLLSCTCRILALLLGIEFAERVGKIHYPRARRWRLVDYGWECLVTTAPRTGRREVEKQAPHIADYWRSVRVEEIAAHLERFGPGQDQVIMSNAAGRITRRNAFGDMWRSAVAAARTCGKPPAEISAATGCRETCADAAHRLPAGTRFHDLRHFYASALISANLNPKVIQARLGHATIAETMDTYGHLFPDAEDLGRTAVDQVLAAALAEQERNRSAL